MDNQYYRVHTTHYGRKNSFENKNLKRLCGPRQTGGGNDAEYKIMVSMKLERLAPIT